MEELGAGEVVGGTVDVYGKVKEPVRVPFDAEEVNALLGTKIEEVQMLEYFARIGLEYDAEAKEVIAPTMDMTIFRQPCRREKPQPENFLISFALRKWQGILQNSVVSVRV